MPLLINSRTINFITTTELVLCIVHSSIRIVNLQNTFAHLSTYMLPWLLVAGDCMYSISVNLTGHYGEPGETKATDTHCQHRLDLPKPKAK